MLHIDKYKHNVNIISVCTNIQKILESIQSRVHILHIRSLDDAQIRVIMDNIIRDESISIDDDAKEYLLRISDRTVRNVINNLEKIFIYGAVRSNLETCKQLCSNISLQKFESYIRSFTKDDMKIGEPIKILYDIHDYGYSVIDILNYFFSFVKITDLLNESQKYRIIPIICKYITIFNKVHENIIELALFTNEITDIVKCK